MPYRRPVLGVRDRDPAAGDAELCPTVWAKYPVPGAIATRLAVPPAPAPTRSSVCTASGIGSAEPASNVREFVLAPAALLQCAQVTGSCVASSRLIRCSG